MIKIARKSKELENILGIFELEERIEENEIENQEVDKDFILILQTNAETLTDNRVLENSQKNLNIIRKFCLAILKRYKMQTKLSINSIRFNISMDFENEVDSIIKGYSTNN